MIEDVTNVLPARTTDDGARPTVLFIGDIGQEFIQLCSEEVRCPELQGLTKVLHVHPSYWQCVSFSIVSLTLRCGQTYSCLRLSSPSLPVLAVSGCCAILISNCDQMVEARSFTPSKSIQLRSPGSSGFLIPIELLPVVR